MKGSYLHLVLVPLFLTAGAVGADKPKGLSTESPFVPPGGATTVSGVTPGESIEFAGVTTIGKKTDLIFYDKVAKKSYWLAKGDSQGGITLLNYDAPREQAVVKINGIEKVLTLRKGQGTAGPGRTVTPVPTGFNNPAPVAATGAADGTTPAMPAPPPNAIQVPLPVAPAGAPPADVVARQETEARMLVSDLLEIGMAQRKAYEEAQRKAAESGAGNPPAPETQVQPPAEIPPR